jgi:hypothetical protein
MTPLLKELERKREGKKGWIGPDFIGSSLVLEGDGGRNGGEKG